MTALTQLKTLLCSIALALLSACAGMSYNLPPVSQDLDGQRRPGKFIWHDLISDDVAGSERFYSELFGWEFQSLSLVNASYWVISLNGDPIGGMVNQEPLPAQKDISQWVSVMSSEDVAATSAAVTATGGQVIRQPVSLGDRGSIAVFADPQGAIFAALETPGGDPVDRDVLPPAGGFLWHELWTSSPDEATEFYTALSGLDATTTEIRLDDDEAVSYTVLESNEQPRAGIRLRPIPEVPPVWLPYLRMESLEQLEAALTRVPSLGGEVLVPAIERAGGGHMAVIAGPSGAPMALQSWADSRAAPGTGITEERDSE